MDAWIDFARGPLFRICLTILVLGLGYRVGVAIAQIVTAWRRAGDRCFDVAAVVRTTLGWIVPMRLLRQRPVYSVASFLMHVGIIVGPLFLAGHVALLEGTLPAAWPVLSPILVDVLTVTALVATAVLLIGRVGLKEARRLSKAQDEVVLVVLFFLVLFGFLAAHPLLSPWPARTMVLIHILLGDLALVLIPTTKIAHCVLYPFSQLVFQLGWHFPADSGRHVSTVLNKEDQPV